MWYWYSGINKYSISCYSYVKGYTFKRGKSTLFNFTATCDPTFVRSFCMQQMGHLLDFWDRSFDQFGERCTDCFMAAQELQKTPQMFHQDDLSPTIISAPFYTYLGGMFVVYIPLYPTIWNKFDWRIFRIASWHLLHHSVWVYGGILIHPLHCIFFLRLYTRLLHRLPIGAPGLFIPGCVGWFFGSVVGRIINLGLPIKDSC
jgi:hypothetical protein